MTVHPIPAAAGGLVAHAVTSNAGIVGGYSRQRHFLYLNASPRERRNELQDES